MSAEDRNTSEWIDLVKDKVVEYQNSPDASSEVIRFPCEYEVYEVEVLDQKFGNAKWVDAILVSEVGKANCLGANTRMIMQSSPYLRLQDFMTFSAMTKNLANDGCGVCQTCQIFMPP